jgi:hypothetical protein
VGEFAAGEVIPTVSSDPLRVDGLAVREGDRTRVVLANMSCRQQRIVVHDLSPHIWLRRLDETNVTDAMSAPESFRLFAGELVGTQNGNLELDMLPYAIARLDSA